MLKSTHQVVSFMSDANNSIASKALRKNISHTHIHGNLTKYSHMHISIFLLQCHNEAYPMKVIYITVSLNYSILHKNLINTLPDFPIYIKKNFHQYLFL